MSNQRKPRKQVVITTMDEYLNSPQARCERCAYRYRKPGTGWNGRWEKGELAGLICPECQDASDNAEAEVNAAMLDYSRMCPDSSGRMWVPDVAG